VATLTAHQVPFAEVSAHRATLEEAYMELTRDAVEFHSAKRDSAQRDAHRAVASS
jgi:ABC-2 type transport system ATP-binding protein